MSSTRQRLARLERALAHAERKRAPAVIMTWENDTEWERTPDGLRNRQTGQAPPPGTVVITVEWGDHEQ